jgi:hypothetical protein
MKNSRHCDEREKKVKWKEQRGKRLECLCKGRHVRTKAILKNHTMCQLSESMNDMLLHLPEEKTHRKCGKYLI